MVSSRQCRQSLHFHTREFATLCPYGTLLSKLCSTVAWVATVCAPTLLYNIVESPVGTIPVTKVDPERDDIPQDWLDGKDRTKSSSPVLEYLLYNKKWPAIYDAHRMAGLPVGVQVVGKKWEEEKVVEMMKVVDAALGKRSFGPGSWNH